MRQVTKVARPKSAKGRDPEMNAYKDFLMDNIKSHKQKPLITVPKGYNFEQREKTKVKSISQMKFEADIEKRERDEQELVNFRFRAKEIPADVLIPK